MRSNLPLFRKLPTAGKKPSAGEHSASTPSSNEQAVNKPGNTTKTAAKKKKKSGPRETEQPSQTSVPLVPSVPSATLVSVLIPARDEEASIGECLTSILACSWSNLEVIVMDDCSSDGTAAICESIAQSDSRVKVMTGRDLPMGWNGKQRACWLMALAAQGQWLLFLDADVRLTPDAIPRLIAQAEGEGIDLLSGFPKQVTGTWLEKLMIPLMHFILLGYLPIARMRDSTGAEFAAGCGQLFLARRTAYMTCEGHKSISNSRHDGVKLPRSFRKQRLKTDIFDASDIATCRMYHNAQQVLRGLLKNASEGIGSPRTIIVFTILLGGAAVLPTITLLTGLAFGWSSWIMLELAIASALSFVPRFWVARRFEQSWLGILLHPLSVLLFLSLQWIALVGEWCGVRISWRGRT